MRRGLIRLLAGLALSSGALLLTPAAVAEEPCLKMVFGRYCLGGDINQILPSSPPPAARQTQGDSLALVFPDGANQLYLLAYSNRLYKVVRAHAVSTQLAFDDIYNDLRQIYGPGTDQSRFPDYASTPAARLASIRRGEGRALHRWEPSPAWSIELSWTRELGVSLAYIATELNARRAARMDGGL
ncbi:hypothetical protein [Thiocystis violacea]|uniref:hypothetical protein n=1 Tax=Thiocystis violacea TaxID=13725 RepID=UPI001906D52B|nr:hypothetical protein [Thiocystis violacea]MBK1718796.1 hypothetical protein [Thiocystis violacea]